jgi:hypothetical protein
MTSLDKAPVEDVLISRIDIGGRRREKPRVTAKFIRSIQDVGLIHPIVIRPNGEEGRFELVAGQRRLEAFRSLGRAKIPARIVAMDDEGLRDVEYDENVERIDFTTFEQSAAHKRELQRKEAEAGATAKDEDFVPPLVRKGRPPKRGSVGSLSEASGESHTAVQRTLEHVDAGERYPFLQDPSWPRTHAIAVAKLLDDIPAKARNATIDMVEKEVLAIDSNNVSDSVRIIKNIASFTPEKQQAITELYRSKDPTERSVAITTAAKRPPMPDLRIYEIDLVLKSLTGIVRSSKDELHDYIKKEIGKCQTILETVKEKVKAAHKEKLALVDP